MPRRYNKSISKNSQLSINKKGMAYPPHRPFWLPAISYYFLTVAIAFVLFFIIWGVLIEGGDETPWIPAGILSSLVLVGAVFIREVFLRNARKRYQIAKKQLDFNLSQLPGKSTKIKKRKKFTLQQNSYMLNQIKEKSDAARVLKRLPQGHLEVLEICIEYLSFTKNELNYIDKNSPRYLSVRKGRKKVKKAHKYHLLKWAEVETKKYTREAKSRANVIKKVESAQKALNILESAIRFYPTDANLIESYEAINEFISTIKITNLVEKAEKAAFIGSRDEAVGLYNDILFFLNNADLKIREKSILIEKINIEISKLNKIHKNDLIN